MITTYQDALAAALAEIPEVFARIGQTPADLGGETADDYVIYFEDWTGDPALLPNDGGTTILVRKSDGHVYTEPGYLSSSRNIVDLA